MIREQTDKMRATLHVLKTKDAPIDHVLELDRGSGQKRAGAHRRGVGDPGRFVEIHHSSLYRIHVRK